MKIDRIEEIKRNLKDTGCLAKGDMKYLKNMIVELIGPTQKSDPRAILHKSLSSLGFSVDEIEMILQKKAWAVRRREDSKRKTSVSFRSYKGNAYDGVSEKLLGGGAPGLGRRKS